jgi:hypothetical protein
MVKDLVKQCIRNWTLILDDNGFSHDYHAYANFKPSTYWKKLIQNWINIAVLFCIG